MVNSILAKCSAPGVDNGPTQSSINDIYNTSALLGIAKTTVPIFHKRYNQKNWWDEEMNILKNESIIYKSFYSSRREKLQK